MWKLENKAQAGQREAREFKSTRCVEGKQEKRKKKKKALLNSSPSRAFK